MDRQGNHETADHAERQFRKALDVIVDSYNGAPADRLYRDAIYCFDSLIEISHNTEAIRDFARRNEMDNKYLVDGANYVISKMHFNSEGNYYITLGLPGNASQDEIRERWKRLMLLYHPDKQIGTEEWVSERAKKVNEAYSTLKDEEKRRSYDSKLVELTIRQHSAIQSKSKTSPSATKPHKLRTSDNTEWDRTKKYIPKILIGLYVLAALVFLGYIYIQNNSELLESALMAKSGQTTQIAETSKEKESNFMLKSQPRTHEDIEESASKPGPLTRDNTLSDDNKAAVSSIIPTSDIAGGPVSTPATSKLPETAAKKQNRTNKVISKEETTQGNAMSLRNMPVRNPESSAWPYGPHSKNKQTIEQASQMPELPVPVSQAKTEPSKTIQQERSSEITTEEVEAFIKLYASFYANNDINTFMSLFSKSAVENNRLHYNEIRKAYEDTFSEKISYYKIHNMAIAINGQTATVSGSYDLSRYMSATSKWMRYSGKIQWRVTRENNMLKIINVNYD